MTSLPNSFLSLIDSKQYDALCMHPKWDRYLYRAFIYACGNTDVDTVSFFISKSCDPAYQTDWPLYNACENGQFEIVKYLLTFENVCKNANANKNRCLISAQRLAYTDIEEILLQIPIVADGPSMNKPMYGF